MARKINQKLKIIRIYEMLLNDSCLENPLTTEYIMSELNKQGISCERRALADDLMVLQKFDTDIQKVRKGKGYGYYLGRKELNLYEIRLLLDMVQSASFLTKQQTNILTSGIAALAGTHKADVMYHNTVVFDKTKHSNEQVADSIEIIEQAITDNKKVSFQYSRMLLGEKGAERVLKRNGERYVVNPMTLLFQNGYYYLVAYADDKPNIVVYRLDRILNCAMEKQSRKLNSNVKSIDEIKEQLTAFYMWAGKGETVKLLVHNDYASEIFDKFGEQIVTKREDDMHFSVVVKVNFSDLFFSWVSMFGNKIKIVAPDTAVNKMKEYIFKKFSAIYFGSEFGNNQLDSNVLQNITDKLLDDIDKLQHSVNNKANI